MSEETALVVHVQIAGIRGRDPKQWLVGKSWDLMEVRTKLVIDGDSVIEQLTDDHLDHTQVAADACLDLIAEHKQNLVELKVDFGHADNLTATAREHMLDRIRNTVRQQRPEVTLHIGWVKATNCSAELRDCWNRSADPSSHDRFCRSRVEQSRTKPSEQAMRTMSGSGGSRAVASCEAVSRYVSCNAAGRASSAGR